MRELRVGAARLGRRVNKFTCSGLFYHKTLDRSISKSRESGLFLLLHVIVLCFIESLHLLQTVRTLFGRHVLQHLIWVYTVCLYPYHGTLGINGLICENRRNTEASSIGLEQRADTQAGRHLRWVSFWVLSPNPIPARFSLPLVVYK